jgi:tetratricopeptide (TPR) repeat protein
MSDDAIRRLLAALVFLASFAVYLMTMAGTVSFWDSGEFIAVSQILGIPHSPGTPMYVLVGRVFAMLPLALSVAQRVNLLSAFTGALGVMMVYLIISEVVRFMFGAATTVAGRIAAHTGGLVGALFLMFSSTYWTDATEAEVYALSAFVMGLCTYLAIRWLRDPVGSVGEEERDKLRGSKGTDASKAIADLETERGGHSRNLILLVLYLLSLGIGFHLGTVLVYGGIFLVILMVRDKSFSNTELIIFTFGLFVVLADMTLHRNTTLTLVGLGVFAVLLIWGTMSRGRFALYATLLFILGVSVHLFMFIRSFHDPAIDMVDPQTWGAMYAHLRREQYPPINVFARKASFAFQLRYFWRYFVEQFRLFGDARLGFFNLGSASVIVPLTLGIWGIVANFMREKKTWVLNFTVLALNSIGLIIFLNFSDSEVRDRDYFYGGAFYYFSVFIGIGATALLMLVIDEVRARSRDALRWVAGAAVVLVILAILPAKYQWFSHDRSRDYIPRDYAYNILAGLEPDAIIFTNGDNDTYPLWYIQMVEGFRPDVNVANLSLLNTSWYIEQLRDRVPPVPISLSDAEIERLRPMVLKDGGVAWRRDLVVQHIIQQNNWKRPIYFAVTVPPEIWNPYAEHLEMQGMVRKLVTKQQPYQVNEFQMIRNFEDIYEFRGVLDSDWKVDDSIYRTPDTRGMFINFAVAAFQLAQKASMRKDYAEAVRWAELSYSLNPDFEFPRRYLGLYYSRAGRFDLAVEHYTREIGRDPSNGDFWMGLASIYEDRGDLEGALEVLDRAIVAAPEHRDLFAHGFRISATLGKREQARGFVRAWLDSHPGDREFRQLYDNIDKVLDTEFGPAVPQAPDSSGEAD